MTDAPKQYRYKHLFSLGGFDAGKTMCCLKQSDSEPFIISNEEFERNFEPVPVWEMSAGGAWSYVSATVTAYEWRVYSSRASRAGVD